MRRSFTNQVLAQIEIFTKTDVYPVGVYTTLRSISEEAAVITSARSASP